MSKKFLNRCLYSLNRHFKAPPNISFQTRRDYLLGLTKMVRDLHAGGYQISLISNLNTKHVHYLLDRWTKEGMSAATIKNRLSQLRYLAKLLKKPDLLPASNIELNVPKRSYISTKSKAINNFDYTRFKDPFIQFSVRLQQEFGLRREESIKFIVSSADQGKYIRLQDSWTKGKIERTIPVKHPAQRALLNELHSVMARDQSLIPEGKTYAEQKKLYDEEVHLSGYKNLHGLRHAYAQKCYHELTASLTNSKGWKAPFAGGPARSSLSKADRIVDGKARLIISGLMGHCRMQISAIYLGR